MNQPNALGGPWLKFTLKSADELFPTPLLRFEVEGAERLNAALIKEIADRQAAEAGITKSNRKGWHSDRDFFDRKEPAHRELAHAVLRMLAQASKAFAPATNFDDIELLADGWININPRGGYNVPHDHSGSFWSGVYYVRVPQQAEGQGGLIEFLAPHKPLPALGLIQAPITAPKISVRPEAGQVLIFPASLTHWVHPNDSDEDRITIAFNSHFRRRRAKAGAAILSNKK